MSRWKIVTAPDRIELPDVHGEQTRRAIAAQPGWLAQVPTDGRFPDGARLLFTGCGTSFHAAMTGGEAVQALELALRPDRDADLLVLVSHEGETPLTLEAARAWHGPRWLVTGRADGPIADLCDEVVVCTPEIEESWCHTASYTCAVAAIAALHGEDISWLPAAVEEALALPLPEVGDEERFVVAGAGRDLATAHEAVLKLREGAWVVAEAYETEQLLHGYLAAVDESVRAFVLEGEGLAAQRAAAAVAALRELGCDVDLLATRHPVVDVVRFQRLTVELAARRGREPDRIRRHDPRWAAAAEAAKADNAS
ncbi:MAG TPA: SIS domain-containing protein [Gaiellaceae bacterium]|nr:SIS domain-containing protein [Gaiellaceae bacterium]